jgi:hypothetical protein
MSQTQKPSVPDETPEAIEYKVQNRNDDVWYEYNGELLWDPETIEAIHERLETAAQTDWEHIGGVRGTNEGYETRTKIRTKDADGFEDAYVERANEVANDIDGWLQSKPAPEIHEKGPQRTNVSIPYRFGHKVSMGGAKYKKQEILKVVEAYERWLFHTRVVEPTFEEYHEKYPY